ncbi:MAG: B12-binding domain-containing radical SAM protein [Promethearchaeota archaeon]
MAVSNLIVKDWRKIDITFGLVYLNKLELMLSSYTIRLLYDFLNSRANVACELFCIPEKVKYPASIDLTPNNSIRSLENEMKPLEFDILGFSLQYELNVKNFFWFLEKSGIPFYSKKREEMRKNENVHIPIIIMGGPVITSNPLPLNNFVDFFFIGDAEPNLHDFLNLFLKYKEKKLEYKELLKEASLIEGIYVPLLKNHAKRAILKSLDNSPTPINQIFFQNNERAEGFSENFLLEINRGCPFACKFCISSYHNRPFRNKSKENLLTSIKSTANLKQFKKISLIGSCVSAHPNFKEICLEVLKLGLNLSIPSMRIDHLSSEIVKILEASGIKSITLAPEAGSEKLRYKLGKRISDEKIISTLREISLSKIKNVKLYFLIGLPDETYDDIESISNMISTISHFKFEKGAIRANINPLIPKFNTPFEKEIDFYISDNMKILINRLKSLQENLGKNPRVKLKFQKFKELVNDARLQVLISLGDENTSKFLLEYYLEGATMGALRRVEKKLSFSLDEYLTRIKNGYKPWTLN